MRRKSWIRSKEEIELRKKEKEKETLVSFVVQIYFFRNDIICWNPIWRGLFYSAADFYFMHQSSNINSSVRICFTSV